MRIYVIVYIIKNTTIL